MPACAASSVISASCSTCRRRPKPLGAPGSRSQIVRHTVDTNAESLASRPYSFTTSSLPSAPRAATAKNPASCRSAAPRSVMSTFMSARAKRTSSRLGRPALEPTIRWTIAAAPAADSNEANTPSEELAPRATGAIEPSVMITYPRRRTGRTRWGDAVMSRAVGMPSRAEGNTGGGWTSPTSAPSWGHAPVTIRPRISHRTTATRIARSMSRPTFARPRASAATSTTSAHNAGRSARTCHAPVNASGRSPRNRVNARENPGSGSATSPTKTMPTVENASRMTSVARRARGCSVALVNRRRPRRSLAPAWLVTVSIVSATPPFATTAGAWSPPCPSFISVTVRTGSAAIG
jgi:hypothetical protein